MNGLTFTNRTDRKLTLIVEPIAEEYGLNAGDEVELRPPLFLDNRQVIEVELTGELVIVYAAVDVEVIKNGKPAHPDNSLR
jgi:hypothetical protein